MEWFKKSTEKLDKCTGVKVGKCMKKLVKSVHLLFCAFLNHTLILLLLPDLRKDLFVNYSEINFKTNDYVIPKNNVSYKEWLA